MQKEMQVIYFSEKRWPVMAEAVAQDIEESAPAIAAIEKAKVSPPVPETGSTSKNEGKKATN